MESQGAQGGADRLIRIRPNDNPPDDGHTMGPTMDQQTGFPATPAQLLPPIFDVQHELGDLPRDIEPWLSGAQPGNCPQISASLRRAQAHGGWHWPQRPIVFLSDPHADADGFLRSLIGAGVIRRGRGGEIALTGFGRQAQIILGGDCLDKGPSNLALLDAVAALRATGADLTILAGNHDLRLHLAVDAIRGPRSPLKDHLFVRMGRKLLPALREVFERFVTEEDLRDLPGEKVCKARLLPPKDWPEAFRRAAQDHIPERAIAKEIKKLKEKRGQFKKNVAKTGLGYRELLAATLKCHEVFFTPGGAYAWFFESMNVVARIGSMLFVHAGLCDRMCEFLVVEGPEAVNARYRKEANRAAYRFYFGPFANLVRTKYRDTDCALTERGVDLLHRNGIHMVVQGHVNNHQGQRLLSKRGLLHLEGDITLDRASRRSEGLEGIGAGATLIYPSGDVIGLSRDYPRAKHFAPEKHLI